MSIDVEAAAPAAQAAEVPPHRTRRIVLGVVLALLLAVLASCLVYRQAVIADREATFRAVWQAQARTALEEMAKVGYGQAPADSGAMSERLQLGLTYVDPDRRITVSTPAMRIGGATKVVQLDAEMYNYDLPGWVGDRSDFISLLLVGTYTNDSDGVTSDEGSCVVRLGSPDAPVLTETVDLGDGLLATPCTGAQLASVGEK